MSRILRATCDASGVVKVGSIVVPDAVVQSQGKQASSGLLFIEQDLTDYVASSSSDLKTTIEKLIAVLDDLTAGLTQVATTLTSIGAGMTGATTAPPPTLATDVVNLNSKITSLTATKTALTTLKGALK